MPRIIAGSLGGRTVPGPPGTGTRPTSDRVREAVFSRLEGWGAIEGAHVLDLFAGTGALAFEALSRGAATAELVESHARTAARAQRTARELGLEGRARVRTARAATRAQELAQQGRELAQRDRALAQRGEGDESGVGADAPFSLVFLDPPYELATEDLEQLLLVLHPALAEDAVVVIERSARSRPVAWPAGYADDGSKSYGETVIQYGGPVQGSDADGSGETR